MLFEGLIGAWLQVEHVPNGLQQGGFTGPASADDGIEIGIEVDHKRFGLIAVGFTGQETVLHHEAQQARIGVFAVVALQTYT